MGRRIRCMRCPSSANRAIRRISRMSDYRRSGRAQGRRPDRGQTRQLRQRESLHPDREGAGRTAAPDPDDTLTVTARLGRALYALRAGVAESVETVADDNAWGGIRAGCARARFSDGRRAHNHHRRYRLQFRDVEAVGGELNRSVGPMAGWPRSKNIDDPPLIRFTFGAERDRRHRHGAGAHAGAGGALLGRARLQPPDAGPAGLQRALPDRSGRSRPFAYL